MVERLSRDEHCATVDKSPETDNSACNCVLAFGGEVVLGGCILAKTHDVQQSKVLSVLFRWLMEGCNFNLNRVFV